MSTIEKHTQSAEQKPKKYDARRQDHGDAAGEKGHYPISEWDKAYDNRAFDKQDDLLFEEALLEADNYNSMSSEQMEAVADRLLGEDTPALLKAAGEIISRVEGSNDETEAINLLDRYQSMHDTRLEILERIEAEGYEGATELEVTASYLADELDLIEDDLIGLMNEQSMFPEEAELGVKSKREIRGKMARQATLDHDYDDDDHGDDDFSSPVRIKNRL